MWNHHRARAGDILSDIVEYRTVIISGGDWFFSLPRLDHHILALASGLLIFGAERADARNNPAIWGIMATLISATGFLNGAGTFGQLQ
jgi:hypothetical protein